VDQTIEKVSFCAPDRNSERGFAYICRDGTSRRWICHGFFAIKDTVSDSLSVCRTVSACWLMTLKAVSDLYCQTPCQWLSAFVVCPQHGMCYR